MTPENKFSNWLCKALRDNGAFVQKLEVTPGRGVPDLVVIMHNTVFLELKFGTTCVRPEQYVWAMHAVTKRAGKVYALCGFDDRMELYWFNSAQALKKSYKLKHLKETFPKTLEGVRSLMHHL